MGAMMLALVVGLLPLPVLFMIAFAIAIMINDPSVSEQKQLLVAHAANAMAVASLIFAAGIFTGILSGMRMVDAMAERVVQHVPDVLGPYLSIVTGPHDGAPQHPVHLLHLKRCLLLRDPADSREGGPGVRHHGC